MNKLTNMVQCTMWAVVASVGTFSSVVEAADFHIHGGASDWTDPFSYQETAVPAVGDRVIIPTNVTVSLNASTDAASLQLVNALQNIALMGDDSRFEIAVGGTDVKEITRPITAYGFSGKTISGTLDYTGGPIVKKGTGTLVLSSCGVQYPGSARNCDYYSTIRVDEGTLKITPRLANPNYLAVLGRVHVEADATLFLPGCDWRNSGVTLFGLSGSGLVTNETYGSYVVDLTFDGLERRGDTSDFAGQLNGKYNTLYFSGDAQTLSGVNSRATFGNVWSQAGSRVYIASQGVSATAPSSVGCGTPTWWVHENGATVGFVGPGSQANAQGFAFATSTDTTSRRAAVIDAGATGNVRFTGGQWQRYYASAGGKSLVLTGTNAQPCVVAISINDNSATSNSEGRGHTMYVSKEGSGTWRFDKTARAYFTSGISVNEGVFEYETIAPTGEACSIGTATVLTDGQWGQADTNAEHRVDYAIRLGAPTLDGTSKTSGRFSYVGTSGGVNADRKVALAGAGGFRSNATSGGIVQNEVVGISADPMRLYLDGDNATDGNVVLKVSDGTAGGKVSVVKEGTGKWHLGNTSDFTGGIEVNGGELVLDSLRYAWYRWTVTDLYPLNATKPYSTWKDGGQKKEFLLYEFGLFDKDGNNQVEHYQTGAKMSGEADIPFMTPGTAQVLAYGGNYLESISQTGTEGGVSSNYYMDVWKAFDVSKSGYGVWGVQYKLMNSSKSQIRIDGNDPNTRVAMVIRVKPDAHDIVGYDYMNVYGGYNSDWNTSIRNAYLDGSVDGIHWDRLHTATDAPAHYDGGMWTYQGGYSGGEEAHTGYYAKSYQIENPHNIARCPAIAAAKTGTGAFAVHSVKLSGGGKLTVAGGADALTVTRLTIDATTGGTLDGATLASNLVLDVLDIPSDQQVIALPITFVNVKGLEGSAGWTLACDGQVKPTRTLSVRNGTFYVMKSGLHILLR